MEDIYPSRGSDEKILERNDPIFFGQEEKKTKNSLSKEQIRFYIDNGFLLFPDFFNPQEVESLFSAYQDLLQQQEKISPEEWISEPIKGDDKGRSAVRSIFNPHRYHDELEKISRDPRILDKVEQILGGGVYIHHARINIKRPLNGKSFPWHSDFETWHAEDGMPRMRALTAWIMLTENSEYNGPLYVIPGSHRRFVACKGYTPQNHHQDSLRKQEYGTPSFDALFELTKNSNLKGVYGKPGTLVIHESNVMHGSPDNISPWSRTNLFFVYNSVENQPAEKPFGARQFRPEFLSNAKRDPLIACS